MKTKHNEYFTFSSISLNQGEWHISFGTHGFTTRYNYNSAKLVCRNRNFNLTTVKTKMHSRDIEIIVLATYDSAILLWSLLQLTFCQGFVLWKASGDMSWLTFIWHSQQKNIICGEFKDNMLYSPTLNFAQELWFHQTGVLSL